MRTLIFSWLVLGLIVSAVAAEQPNTLTAQEITDGWILLFDGETTFGWEPGSKADWSVANGVISVTSGEQGILATTCEFSDFELRVDFKADKASNSGVFLRSPLVPKDPSQDCYELNIADPPITQFPTGSFVQRKKSDIKVEPGAWHTFHVKATGADFKITLDGQDALQFKDDKPVLRGRVGLQYNMGKVEFRNVKLKPLSQKALFSGKDLSGWKVSTDAKAKSEFTVGKDGELHIKNGPGQIESEAKLADFTLQADVFSNGKALNSGIFFRSIPGEWWNGYECQIQNGYKDNDRTKPVDCGTGGIYRRQNARKVVANDFEWFTLTLCANGPHMAAWVNGYQVSDWTDTRAANDNPRQGQRIAAGTLILQGHDATTDLSFRNLRAVELSSGH